MGGWISCVEDMDEKSIREQEFNSDSVKRRLENLDKMIETNTSFEENTQQIRLEEIYKYYGSVPVLIDAESGEAVDINQVVGNMVRTVVHYYCTLPEGSGSGRSEGPSLRTSHHEGSEEGENMNNTQQPNDAHAWQRVVVYERDVLTNQIHRLSDIPWELDCQFFDRFTVENPMSMASNEDCATRAQTGLQSKQGVNEFTPIVNEEVVCVDDESVPDHGEHRRGLILNPPSGDNGEVIDSVCEGAAVGSMDLGNVEDREVATRVIAADMGIDASELTLATRGLVGEGGTVVNERCPPSSLLLTTHSAALEAVGRMMAHRLQQRSASHSEPDSRTAHYLAFCPNQDSSTPVHPLCDPETLSVLDIPRMLTHIDSLDVCRLPRSGSPSEPTVGKGEGEVGGIEESDEEEIVAVLSVEHTEGSVQSTICSQPMSGGRRLVLSEPIMPVYGEGGEGRCFAATRKASASSPLVSRRDNGDCLASRRILDGDIIFSSEEPSKTIKTEVFEPEPLHYISLDDVLSDHPITTTYSGVQNNDLTQPNDTIPITATAMAEKGRQDDTPSPLSEDSDSPFPSLKSFPGWPLTSSARSAERPKEETIEGDEGYLGDSDASASSTGSRSNFNPNAHVPSHYDDVPETPMNTPFRILSPESVSVSAVPSSLAYDDHIFDLDDLRDESSEPKVHIDDGDESAVVPSFLEITSDKNFSILNSDNTGGGLTCSGSVLLETMANADVNVTNQLPVISTAETPDVPIDPPANLVDLKDLCMESTVCMQQNLVDEASVTSDNLALSTAIPAYGVRSQSSHPENSSESTPALVSIPEFNFQSESDGNEDIFSDHSHVLLDESSLSYEPEQVIGSPVRPQVDQGKVEPRLTIKIDSIDSVDFSTSDSNSNYNLHRRFSGKETSFKKDDEMKSSSSPTPVPSPASATIFDRIFQTYVSSPLACTGGCTSDSYDEENGIHRLIRIPCTDISEGMPLTTEEIRLYDCTEYKDEILPTTDANTTLQGFGISDGTTVDLTVDYEYDRNSALYTSLAPLSNPNSQTNTDVQLKTMTAGSLDVTYSTTSSLSSSGVMQRHDLHHTDSSLTSATVTTGSTEHDLDTSGSITGAMNHQAQESTPNEHAVAPENQTRPFSDFSNAVLLRSLDDPAVLIGWEVFVEDMGVGQITSFSKSRFFATRFEIQFQSKEKCMVPLKRGSKKSGSNFTLLRKLDA